MNSVRRSSVAMWASAILLVGCAEAVQAQAILTVLTVSGPPAPFVISTAVAGSEPAAITNSVTTYYVLDKKPAGTRKISAALDSPMPPGTTLTIQLVPSAGATSLGPVSMDMTDRNLVVGIYKDNGSTLGITYVFTATVSAGVVTSQSRNVTFTLSNYP